MKSRKPLRRIATIATVVAVLAVAMGCGGSQTTASRSAEEYDAARAKGEPVKTDDGHGGHAATPPPAAADTASPGTSMDHAAMGHAASASPQNGPGHGSGMAGMAGMDHSKMAMPSNEGRRPGQKTAMDHSRMPGMARRATGGYQKGSLAMDHSRMAGAGAHNMPGMSSSPTAPAGGATPGHMDHSTMTSSPGTGGMAGMTHAPTTGASGMAAMQHGTMTAPVPEPPARAAAPAEPARTLQTDPLDMPAPTAVEGATRAAAMATEMAAGHMMSHGTYRQTDAGRDQGTATPAGMPPGHQMNQTPMPQPSTGGGHQMHATPPATPGAPRTAPAPGRPHQPSRPQSEPAPGPHLQHQPSAPASPSPRPSPTPKESNE